MRTLLALLSVVFLGCSSNKSGDDDSGTGADSGVKTDAAVDAGKDAGIADTGGADAAKLDGYYAWGHQAAMSQLFIYFADAQNDVCYRIHLTSPGTNMSAVTIPNNWTLQDVGTGAVHSAQACSPYYSGSADILQNLSSSGTLNWSGTVPPTIYTVDVTLNFAPSMWAASSQQLMTMSLPVTMF